MFNARSTEKTIKSWRHDQLENTIKSSRQDQMKKTIQNQLENSIESSISSIEKQLKVQNCCFLFERGKLRIRDFGSHDNWYYLLRINLVLFICFTIVVGLGFGKQKSVKVRKNILELQRFTVIGNI